ncbi:MAG: hypothetical protein JSS49_18895 [Planctomycetes bacterium]|nr:hypothetical protein [Planctomycetota bacterium]
MKILVSCDDPGVMRRLRSALHGLNADWGLYSAADARVAKETNEGETGDQIVLFGSQTIGAEQIHRLNEIQQEIGGESRLIVVGGLPDQSILLELMDAGVTAFIDASHDLEAGIRRQIERLTIGRSLNAQQGRLFAVIPSSGGCGASFLASNLAAGIASQKLSCCLIDLKSQGGDLATILRLVPRHNIQSLAAQSDQIDRAMFEQSLIQHECGVQLLAGVEPYSDSPGIDGTVMLRILRLARSLFSAVVIELDDVESPESLRLLAQCERIVIPLRLDFTSLRRTKRMLERLEKAQIPLENVLAVANRCGEARQFRIESVEQLLEVSVAHQIPDAPQAVNESVNLGSPIVTTAPRSRVGASIMDVVNKVLNPLGSVVPQNSSRFLRGWLRAVASRS